MSEDIIEKIKKLLALADPEKNDSQAQIEAALAKVAELLERHNLSIEEVEAYEGHKPIEKEFVGCYEDDDHTLFKNEHNQWLITLGSGIAFANYCIALYTPRSVSFIGRVEDTKIAAFMLQNLFHRLVAISGQEMQKYMTEYRDKTGQSAWRAYGYRNARVWRKEWLEGAAEALRSRLTVSRRERQERIIDAKDDEQYAVMVAHDKALNQWLEENMPWVKTIKKVREANGSYEAWKAGHNTGKSMQLQSGIEGNNQAVAALGE